MPVDPEVKALLENQTVHLTELINGLKRSLTASNERCEAVTRENAAILKQLAEVRAENDTIRAENVALRAEIAASKSYAADELAKHKLESAAAIKAAVVASNAKINGLKIQLDDLEQYGRRKSIRIQNVPVVPNEDKDKSQDLLLKSINSVLEPTGIVLRHKDTIRFHRSSAAKDDKNVQGGKVSQCLVKLKNWPLRRLFQGLNTRMRKEEEAETGGGCRVYHDLTKRRLALLNEARGVLRDGWFAYADVNSNLKLRKGDRFLNFNTSEELAAHVESLFPQAADEPPQAAGDDVADISDISDLHESESA